MQLAVKTIGALALRQPLHVAEFVARGAVETLTVIASSKKLVSAVLRTLCAICYQNEESTVAFVRAGGLALLIRSLWGDEDIKPRVRIAGSCLVVCLHSPIIFKLLRDAMSVLGVHDALLTAAAVGGSNTPLYAEAATWVGEVCCCV